MTPTIGRIVHWYGATSDPDVMDGPHAALITCVVPEGSGWPKGFVNLCVYELDGSKTFGMRAGFSDSPMPGCWCWPPRAP